MFQTKFVEKMNTHTFCVQNFLFSYFFGNFTVYEITWKKFVERGRPQMTIRRMRIACWIPKATYTHSQYVILTAFPQQQ